MAGIYSQGGSAGHRYAGWLSEVEAKNFTFGGKVFNGSPSAIYVGSNLVWAGRWLTVAAAQAILGAFGQRDGWAVINATNAYLTKLAASGQAGKDKATALAGFINTYAIEDPKIVYSLVPTLGVYRTLDANGTSYFDTGVTCNQDTVSKYFGYVVAAFGAGATHMAGTTSQQYLYGFYNGGSTSWDDYGDDYNLGPHFNNTWMPSGWHEIYKDKAKLYIDGTLIRTASASTFTTRTLAVLANHWQNSYSRIAITGNKMAKLELSSNGQDYLFVPILRNGVAELIDLVSGNLATRTGSFTISETPSTP